MPIQNVWSRVGRNPGDAFTDFFGRLIRKGQRKNGGGIDPAFLEKKGDPSHKRFCLACSRAGIDKHRTMRRLCRFLLARIQRQYWPFSIASHS